VLGSLSMETADLSSCGEEDLGRRSKFIRHHLLPSFLHGERSDVWMREFAVLLC
jgi:hypothetical protein